jgi:Holliday junction resolvase RusA-like endonuclease
MKCLTKDNQNRLNKSIVVWIRGDPIPLQRPKLGRNGTYDPQKDLKYQTGIQLKTQVNFNYDYSSLDGDLSLDITFYFEIPKSWSLKKKEKVAGKRKSSRPDLSNLIKYYEDVMQDIGIYKDDSQIVAISAEKFYDDGQGARVVITLKEVNET